MECNSDAHGGHAVSYVRFLVSSSRSDTRKRVVVFRAMPRLCRIRARSRQLYLGETLEGHGPLSARGHGPFSARHAHVARAY